MDVVHGLTLTVLENSTNQTTRGKHIFIFAAKKHIERRDG